ncbi:hypothetical protein H0O03_00630 [Candidatus Micrarchaeota archaeon]|nr:hypothetical protein [Candidatus Micrarchaeota archaeon]
MRRGQLAVEYIIVMTIIVIVIAVLVVFFKESFVQQMSTSIDATSTGYNDYLRAGGVGEPNLTTAQTEQKTLFSGGVEVLGQATAEMGGVVAEQIYHYRWLIIGSIILTVVGYAAYRLTRSYS